MNVHSINLLLLAITGFSGIASSDAITSVIIIDRQEYSSVSSNSIWRTQIIKISQLCGQTFAFCEEYNSTVTM
jgi:hypothetical protein